MRAPALEPRPTPPTVLGGPAPDHADQADEPALGAARKPGWRRSAPILRAGLPTLDIPRSPAVESGMNQGMMDGWIEVISGVMFSGKSEELMRRVRRAILAKKRVQVFKSCLDDRYGGIGEVVSHDGGRVRAEPIQTAPQQSGTHGHQEVSDLLRRGPRAFQSQVTQDH